MVTIQVIPMVHYIPKTNNIHFLLIYNFSTNYAVFQSNSKTNFKKVPYDIEVVTNMNKKELDISIINTNEYKEVPEKITGKKIISISIGDSGFDLVFEDGTILEMYDIECILENTECNKEKYMKLIDIAPFKKVTSVKTYNNGFDIILEDGNVINIRDMGYAIVKYSCKDCIFYKNGYCKYNRKKVNENNYCINFYSKLW